jgi:hypothetical protein
MEIQFKAFINRISELLNMHEIYIKNHNYIRISNMLIYDFVVFNRNYSISYDLNGEFNVILLSDDNYIFTTTTPDRIFHYIVNYTYQNHKTEPVNFSNDWCVNFL